MDTEPTSSDGVSEQSEAPSANEERIKVEAAPAGTVVTPDLNGKPSPESDGPVQITGATVVTVKNTKKKVIVLALVLALVGVAAGVYFLLLRKDTKTTNTAQTQQSTAQTTTSAGASIDYAPRFNAVYSYAEFASAKWYAVSGGVIKVASNGETAFFSNAQGVPTGTPQKLVVYNDQLWLASQDGIATLANDGKTFAAKPVDGKAGGLSNGDLFYDASAKKIYANDFEGFYVYNTTSNKWESQNGPKNVQSFAANDKYITAYGSKEGWPIWVYDKAKSQWTVKKPALEDQTATVFAIDGNLFIAGRSKGYTSCNDAGKVTATSVFMLDASGNWQPLTAFNNDKSRPELMILRSATGGVTRVKTSTCGANETTKSYELTYKNDTLTLTNETALTTEESGTLRYMAEQKTFIADLIKATKLHPSMHVLDVDGKGNVVFSYSDAYSDSSSTQDTGIAVANKNIFSDATVIDMSSVKNGTNYPVMCGVGQARKLAYVFSGTQHILVGGGEGYPDGLWSAAKLYKVDGTKLTLAADLGEEVSHPSFLCTDKEVVWLGKTSLRRMARDTAKVEAIGAALTTKIKYTSSAFAITPTGNAWFSFSASPDDSSVQAASTLYFYDTAKGAYTKVASKINVQSIQAATDTHALVYENTGKEPKHTVYDASGKALQSITTGQSAYPAVSLSGKTNEFLVLMPDSASNQSVFTPFVVNKLVVGSALAKLAVTNNGFKTMYASGGSVSFFGLVGPPYAVLDSLNNKLWLSDDVFGINALTLP